MKKPRQLKAKTARPAAKRKPVRMKSRRRHRRRDDQRAEAHPETGSFLPSVHRERRKRDRRLPHGI
jgi:hypothetical protein